MLFKLVLNTTNKKNHPKICFFRGLSNFLKFSIKVKSCTSKFKMF